MFGTENPHKFPLGFLLRGEFVRNVILTPVLIVGVCRRIDEIMPIDESDESEFGHPAAPANQRRLSILRPAPLRGDFCGCGFLTV